jgi:hypothetical protein
MRPPVRSILALPIIAALAACTAASPGSLTDPNAVASDLRGTWSDTVSYPGISTIMHLAVVDTTVSGAGTYAIEAGRSGTLTVTGVISGADVKLDLLRDYGLLAHFSGRLSVPTMLGGYVTYASAFVSDPAPMGFRRTGP